MNDRTAAEPQSSTLIRTPDQRLRVFISSTMRDLADERQAARAAIERLRLAPVMFEVGARPHTAGDVYRAYLDQSHIFIGIYWKDYGWVAPGAELSGLEEEYQLAKSKPRLIYIKSSEARGERLQKLLDHIRDDDQIAYKHFSTPAELEQLIQDDLALLLTERFELGSAQALTKSGSRLPAPLTSIVGRDVDVAAVSGYLARDGVRLLTLTGPGGTGKTRLALAAAAELLEQFDEVVFVPLAPVTDADLVLGSIADALDVRDDGPRPLIDRLIERLADRRILLVVDNFEQVIDAAPIVSKLLTAAAMTKVLVTSRERLHLYGEHEFLVSPLPLPDPNDIPVSEGQSFEALSTNAAVTLFVDRARAANPSFALQSENAAAVARICVRLSGLPLAIELAAARIKLMPAEALAKRIDESMDVLASTMRDLPPRQRTMRVTIEWSYALMTPAEQQLFARLGVFAGSFSADAAEALGGQDTTLIDLLESLVTKSLLTSHQGATGNTRFSMLEVIRENSLAHLDDSGELAIIRRAHATFFTGLADDLGRKVWTGQGHACMAQLRTELDNIRVALDWLLEHEAEPDRIAYAARVASSLRSFWYQSGRLTEGRIWSQRILARTNAIPTRERGLVLMAAGQTAMWHGDIATAEPRLAESVAIFRELEDRSDLGPPLAAFGALAISRGDEETAGHLLEESLETFRETGDPENISPLVILSLADVAMHRGDYSEAKERIDAVLDRQRVVGNRHLIARCLNSLGEVERCEGHYESAEELYGESQSLFAAVNSPADIARCIHSRGHVARARGDIYIARELFLESIAFFGELALERGIAECLVGLAAVAVDEGDLERSAQLLGAAKRMLQSFEAELWPADKLVFDEIQATLARSHIDREGRLMSSAEALALARG